MPTHLETHNDPDLPSRGAGMRRAGARLSARRAESDATRAAGAEGGDAVARCVAAAAESAATALGRWLTPETVRARLETHAFALLGADLTATPEASLETDPAAGPDAAAETGPEAGTDGPAASGNAMSAGMILTWGSGELALVERRTSAESRPFPHALCWYLTRMPQDAAESAALRAAIAAAGLSGDGAAIDPIAIFRHGPLENAPATAIPVTPYKRWIAGAVGELLGAAPPAGVERVTIRRPPDLSFYPSYRRMYEAFWRAEPALGRRIGMEEPEQLAMHASHDGLRLIEVDGELAGVIGGFRHCEVGLGGWRLEERVLDERFRGQGLAAAALRRYVESLACAAQDLIWGTILVEHSASLRSALRLGRVDIGGLWWLCDHDPVRAALDRAGC
ncbi:MAG TPA: hypothetical protein PKC43_07920 [Phycisphaerales bacterium]|nr:hypothetical protein [Phycisphaerales bacterium]HMP37364.1 hypothetical protein [Phycisphaerales bacterium]